MTTAQEFYTQQGFISQPGVHEPLFEHLPETVEDLVRIVQGVTLHVFWAESYGFKIPAERMGELQLRTMERRLARTLELDPRPLSSVRPVETRLLGNCRDFSLLLTALLRRQGIPARARCGFGAYFIPNHYEDHWVAEYWNAAEERWILVDAQLDELQSKAMKIGFNPLESSYFKLELFVGQVQIRGPDLHLFFDLFFGTFSTLIDRCAAWSHHVDPPVP